MLDFTTLRQSIAVTIFSFLFLFCQEAGNKEASRHKKLKSLSKETIAFQLSEPDKVINLERSLREISSLTYYNDSTLICVEDENADIYQVDINKGQIIEHLVSNKKGDYEGIELVDNNLFILKSSGTLHEIENFNKINSNEIKYNTELNSKNNTEGLGFDSRTNSLLIACKNEPNLSKSINKINHVRCVYQFDITTKTLQEKPFLTINLDTLNSHYDIDRFMPSGIAVQPITGDFYIISSVGNWLIVLNRKNEIVHAEKLPHKLYEQPEGICFSPNGKILYISNEGKDKDANILIFKSK